jgi:hypothetical protein
VRSILLAIFDDAIKGIAGFNLHPHLPEDLFGHIRVTNQIMRFAN